MTQVSSSGDTPVDVFPPFLPNLSTRDGLREMDIISNLEVTRDLEFDNRYIVDMIEKFSITPILCHKCNDLSKHFMDPAYYVNKKYVKNAKWVLNKNSINSMNIEPYNSLTVPVFDISNIALQHPANKPVGKIHLVRESSELHEKSTFVN